MRNRSRSILPPHCKLHKGKEDNARDLLMRRLYGNVTRDVRSRTAQQTQEGTFEVALDFLNVTSCVSCPSARADCRIAHRQ